MDTQTRVGMAMDEFIQQFGQQPFELINGERIDLMPPVAIHAYIIKCLMALLTAYEQSAQAGQAFSEAPFVLADAPGWVSGSRVPDVLFFTMARWRAYVATMADWKDKPFVLVPDLCVEVVSKHDAYEAVDEKVAGYLDDGVRLVWVVNPRSRSVKVYTAGSNQSMTLKEADTLTGADVLPGFTAPVRGLFPA